MAIQWIFRYLKRTKGLKLTYHGSTDLKLHGFSNSNYQGCLDNQKSTSGFVFTLCGGAIVWKSKKQECVAQSTMKVEYVALNAPAKEAIFLKQFLAKLQLWSAFKNLFLFFVTTTLPLLSAKIQGGTLMQNKTWLALLPETCSLGYLKHMYWDSGYVRPSGRLLELCGLTYYFMMHLDIINK